MTSRTSRLCVLFFACAIMPGTLLQSGDAIAAEIRPMSLNEVVRQADAIVVGTIRAHRSRWGDASRRWMQTDYEMTVENIIYPSEAGVPISDTILLTYWGGTIGNEMQAVADVRLPADGERLVLMLHSQWAQRTTIAPTVGFNAGLFVVIRDMDSGRMVVHDAADRPLKPANDGRIAIRGAAASGETTLDIDAFTEWLHATVRPLKAAPATPQAAPDPNDFRLMKVFAKSPLLSPLNGTGGSVAATSAPPLQPVLTDHGGGVPVANVAAEALRSAPSTNSPASAGVASSEVYLKPTPNYVTSHEAIPPIIVNNFPSWIWPSPEDQYQMSKWNYYADIFRVYTTPTGTYGWPDGVFDLAGFPSDADLQRVYGATWYCGSSCITLGETFRRYDLLGFGSTIIEADIALNPNANWTLDDEYVFSGGPVNSFRQTMTHELGHMHGLDHNFTFLACMNYLEPGNYRAFSFPYADDAAGIRAEYPSNAVGVTDLAIYLYYESATCSNLNNCVSEATYPGGVTAGGSLTVNNYHVENVGTSTIATPTIDWYLTTARNFGSAYYFLGETTYSPSLPSDSYYTPSTVARSFTVPSNVPAGSYYLAAYIPNDGGPGQSGFPFGNNNAFSLYTIAVSVPSYTISVSASPAGGGTVGGGGTFPAGTSRTVTASANSGYTFANWTENGGVVSTSSSYTFTLNSNRSLVANFSTVNYTISVSASPAAGGTVGGGGTFPAGSARTVTASVNTGYSFVNWTENGGVVSTSSSYTFTLNSNRVLVANFTSVSYTVSLSASPNGGGSVSGGGTYPAGSLLTVTATANSGYMFTNWTENGSVVGTSSSYVFILNNNRVLVANFTPGHRAMVGDFNADLHSDIFWRNASTGQVSLWLMNGTTPTYAVSPTTVASPWTAVAFGDFDTDGKADAFWMNGTTGETSIWAGWNGSNFSTQAASTTRSTAWHAYSAGDIDNDTHSDIFWYNSSTGQTEIWFMNGTSYTSVATTTVPTSWVPAVFGDFDGDGKSDIFWRNVLTGETSIWLGWNGTAFNTQVRSVTTPTAWVPMGAGDCSGDGKADIFWRNVSTGETSIWFMNGTATPTWAVTTTVPTAWKPVWFGDFDGDGKTDIFWRNINTGETSFWLNWNGTAWGTQVRSATVSIQWVPAPTP